MSKSALQLLLIGILGVMAGRMELFGQGTAFTYQGQLTDGGGPANGYYDLSFGLYSTNAGGISVGSILTNSSVTVSNGLFTTVLDFGLVFDGTPYWLEIGVQPAGGTNGFTLLSPRQSLNSSPYAAYAANAGTVSGVLASSNLPASVVLLNSSPNFSGTVAAPGFAGDGSGLTNLNAAQLSGGLVPTNVIPLLDSNQLRNVNISQVQGTLPLGQLPGAVLTNGDYSKYWTNGMGLIISTNAQQFELCQRWPGEFLFPVVTVRPVSSNSYIAQDLMPNGSPSDNNGIGFAWLDICDRDCIASAPSSVNTLHLSAAKAAIEVSSMLDYGGTGKSLWLGLDLNPYITINRTGLIGFGLNNTNPAAPFDFNSNISASGTITAFRGIASYATNCVPSADPSGWTNIVQSGWSNAISAVVNIAGTSGSYVFYMRGGTAGTNVASMPLFTNTVIPGGATIPVPVNCGVAIVNGVGVTIQAYAQ